MSEIRALADELHDLLMTADPFGATMLGVPGHDAEVPDVGTPAAEALRQRLLALGHRAAEADAGEPEEQVTLACVVHLVESHMAGIEAATIEHTLSPMADGPAVLLLLASQTALPTAEAGTDYLARLRASPAYVEGCMQRLRAGLAAGRTPVATLARVVLDQLDGYLSVPVDGGDALAAPAAAADWEGAPVFRTEVEQAIADSVRPAFARYRAVVADELLPAARDDEHVGLVHLPGGRADYERLVRVHTTLAWSAQEVHDTGLAAVEELVAQMTELGRRLGIEDFAQVLDGARAASAGIDPLEAMASARVAVARAEAAAPGFFPEPLPEPCAVEPMSDHLARAGLPPMYFPPSPDGARPGTYLFNAYRPNAGSGWDLEATAYHEAVPGHHLQISRTMLQADLPALQRQNILTAQAEGWGLYAELLADEMGLYTDDYQRLGALAMRATRAARLVVDSGIHALGWTRVQALDYMRSSCPLPLSFLESEVNRYIGWPGQALAYFTGFTHIRALRARAEAALGAEFDVRAFHGVLLDAGSVPLPALTTAVEAWITA